MWDFESMILLTMDDAEDSAAWLDRWSCSYPSCLSQKASKQESLVAWQEKWQAILAGQRNMQLMIVAYGTGALSFLAWLYQGDIVLQRQIKGVILVSPTLSSWQEDEEHTLMRAHANFPCAIIEPEIASEDQLLFSRHLALQMGGKFILSPENRPLNQHLNGWQWGMKLMQEMLIYGQ